MSTVGIYASVQALESLITHLLSDELPEAHTVGRQILDEARKTTPMLLEDVDKPKQGATAIAYRTDTYAGIKQLAYKLLPPNHAAETAPVTLTGYTPRNELDIVADILYEHSGLPLEAIRKEAAAWPYQRKADLLAAYMGERFTRNHRPGRALETIHYSFDLICDYGSFRDLQRHHTVDDLEWQVLSPRLGYDVPRIVEQAGLTDAFEECFDLSLQLYSALQTGFPLEAQYATLLGHKVRGKVTYNAREAFRVHEIGQQGNPSYHTLVKRMHAKVAEVHPLIAGAMQFIVQEEDVEQVSPTAKLRTAGKLERLDNAKSAE
jgi:hypothetical protein